MKHLTDDELILYFYGEARRRAGQIDQHLGECAECAAVYRDIAGTLTLVSTPDAPARGEHYGEEVWQRIRYQLPEQEHVGWFAWMNWHRTALAAAAALLIVAAGASRLWTARATPAAVRPAATIAETTPADVSERVRLAAIGDHLDQSERVLLDVANAQGKSIDVSAQQKWAAALIDDNRLYRDAAAHAGDQDIATLLDELERSLLDIVHGPSRLTPAELDRALVRLDAATLLFKIRVIADELRERELAPGTNKPRTTL